MKINSITTYKQNNNFNTKSPSFKADVRILPLLDTDCYIPAENEAAANKTLQQAKEELKKYGSDNIMLILAPFVKKRIFGADRIDLRIIALFKDYNIAKKEIFNSMSEDWQKYEYEKKYFKEFFKLNKEEITEQFDRCYKSGPLQEVVAENKQFETGQKQTIKLVPDYKDIVDFGIGMINSYYKSACMEPRLSYADIVVNKGKTNWIKPEFNPNLDIPV